jgi:hypothetical protein
MKKWHKNPNQLKDLRARAEGRADPPLSPTQTKVGMTSDGEVAAACFAIFDREEGPVEAVKQLKIAPGVVNELFDKYIEMKATHFIRGIDWARLTFDCWQAGYGWPSDVPGLERVLRGLSNDRRRLLEFTYLCAECDKPILAGKKVWRELLYGDGSTTGDGKGHLGTWGHIECVR